MVSGEDREVLIALRVALAFPARKSRQHRRCLKMDIISGMLSGISLNYLRCVDYLDEREQ